MDEQLPQQLSKAELRARLVGSSPVHHRDDITFWQTASEKERGEALYELLALTERITASIPTVRQETQRLILQPGRIVIQPWE